MCHVQTPLTAVLCRRLVKTQAEEGVLREESGDASEGETFSFGRLDAPVSEESLQRLRNSLDAARLGVLSLPAAFHLAAAESYPLSLRPLLLDVAMHCTEGSFEIQGDSEVSLKKMRVAEFVHAATTAVLSRLFIELCDPRTSDSAKE